MVVSDMSENLYTFFFSLAKFSYPGVGIKKVGNRIYSRLGLDQGIMMEEER